VFAIARSGSFENIVVAGAFAFAVGKEALLRRPSLAFAITAGSLR